MPDIDNKPINIEDRRHFYKILFNLRTVKDILKNIDHLINYASSIGKMNLLINSINPKSPEICKALIAYLFVYKRATLNTDNGYIRSTKSCSVSCPTFTKWAEDKQSIPIKILINSKNTKTIKPSGEYNGDQVSPEKPTRVASKKRNQDACASCPYCGKKFRPNSSDTLATHTCRSAKKRRKYVWVISGGGGPGTGKRR
jgi:hypothetical protein